MKVAYFDCFSGAAGDMILAALISAGLDGHVLREDLARLNLTGYDIRTATVNKQGFAAVKFDVDVQESPRHRHLKDIGRIIDGSTLRETVKDRARRIFTRLAEAEASVHGTTPEKVHFHEVGAIDAIVDIVGACIALDRLGIERVRSSPIPVGGGTVRCEHGLMPVPAPATAELLRGFEITPCEEQAELCTPTGAAILTTLAEGFGPMPRMRVASIGYGAGTREGKTRPNVLRVFLGEEVSPSDLSEDEVVLLETNLDDATGQQVGHAVEALFGAGALDVFTTPIQMKKNRPGVMLSALTTAQSAAACEEVMFTATPTFGVRRTVCGRRKLDRRIEKVATKYGEIRVKLGLRGGRVLHVSPEYDDCAAAALRAGVGLADVSHAARAAWSAKGTTSGETG